jgi:hypothetical protein
MALSFSHMANRLIQFGRKNTTEQPKGYSSNHPKTIRREPILQELQRAKRRPYNPISPLRPRGT